MTADLASALHRDPLSWQPAAGAEVTLVPAGQAEAGGGVSVETRGLMSSVLRCEDVVMR